MQHLFIDLFNLFFFVNTTSCALNRKYLSYVTEQENLFKSCVSHKSFLKCV